MKFKYGWIGNSKTGERKHIVTKMTAQMKMPKANALKT